METEPIYSKPVIESRKVEHGKYLTPISQLQESRANSTVVIKKFTTKYDCPVGQGPNTQRVSSHRPKTVPVEMDVTEQDVIQVESSFRSQQTQIFVCGCLANLYEMNMGPSTPRSPGTLSNYSQNSSWSSSRSDASSETSSTSSSGVVLPDPLTTSPDWILSRTGIPVLLFDKGNTKARDKRRLQIVLAEKGSGFALWYDVIDNLSNYRALAPSFHVMHKSHDHRQMAGLSFDRLSAANDFWRRIELLTSDPLNISLSIPKTRGSKRSRKNSRHKRSSSVGPPSRGSSWNLLPAKGDISMPCCFQHVISVEVKDREKLFSLATLVPSFGDLTLDDSIEAEFLDENVRNALPLRTRSSNDLLIAAGVN